MIDHHFGSLRQTWNWIEIASERFNLWPFHANGRVDEPPKPKLKPKKKKKRKKKERWVEFDWNDDNNWKFKDGLPSRPWVKRRLLIGYYEIIEPEDFRSSHSDQNRIFDSNDEDKTGENPPLVTNNRCFCGFLIAERRSQMELLWRVFPHCFTT